MANISENEVLHIAKLSKLDLSQDKKKLYGQQLSTVLDYVGKLSKVDTSALEETSNVTGLKNRYRDDKVLNNMISYSDIASNAPSFSEGFFVVPQIFE